MRRKDCAPTPHEFQLWPASASKPPDLRSIFREDVVNPSALFHDIGVGKVGVHLRGNHQPTDMRPVLLEAAGQAPRAVGTTNGTTNGNIVHIVQHLTLLPSCDEPTLHDRSTFEHSHMSHDQHSQFGNWMAIVRDRSTQPPSGLPCT